MALVNTKTNEYLKITSIDLDFQAGNYNIQYYIFKDADQRSRFDVGLSEYELYKASSYNSYGIIESKLTAPQTKLMTAKDTIFAAAYNSLKADIYTGWTDA